MIDRVDAAVGAEIGLDLRPRLSVAGVPLPIYLCFGPLVQAMRSSLACSVGRSRQRLLGQSTLDMRLILSAAMASF